mmetsp:Transcript_80446/g.236644  ORF Transcript_80446/g.236644 Transcript_80446/m.236644 type:complete len:912 (-) Transcript_80446:94-2829(-)
MPPVDGTIVDRSDRWRRPCRVDSLGIALPNVKDTDVATFTRAASAASEHLRQLRPSTDSAAADEGTTATTVIPILGPRRVCTESQLTFTVPPTTPPFLIRFRVNVDGRNGPWANPLTWEDGYFFSPKLRGGSGGLATPPAVLLSTEWEKANVEGKWAWQDQVARPEEGELRLFTLAGLTPSVVTSGVSGWLVGRAGQGLFGTRTVQVEFAESRGQSWEATEDWTLLEPLEYQLPSVDAMTAMLTLGLNWGRSQGVKKMQEALISELGHKNRKANVRMVRDFALDMHEKLLPVWHSSIEPWMAQNPTLAFFVAERRSEMLRHCAVELLEQLRRRGLVQAIPPALMPLRPKLLSLRCRLHGEVIDGSDLVELSEGEALTLIAEAAPMAAGVGALKLWWLVQATNEPGLDVPSLIGQADGMHVGPGNKVRLPQLKGEGDRQDVTHSELCVPGRNQWGNPVLQAGMELTVRALVEEHGAHEDDCKDVKLRVIANNQDRRGVVEARQREIFTATPLNPEEPYRRTAPRVWGVTRPKAELAERFAADVAQGCNTSEAARAALEAAGLRPTPADLVDAAAAAGESGTVEARAERFASWYEQSVFGNSLFEEGWRQVQDSLRRRRNRLLAGTLEIPHECWGFGEDEWGGVVPEMGLMQQHVARVAKRHLASTWAAREATRHASTPTGSGESAINEDSPQQQEKTLPCLEDQEDVDRATLLAVSEAFGAGMAKHYMSRLLPTASFGQEQRKSWLDSAVQDQSLLASAEQLVAFRLAEYFRVSHSQETAAAREAAEASAAAREKAAAEWLERWREGGAAAGPPPQEVELVEVVKVVAKTTVKEEVAHFLEVQLLPMVRTQLRERVVPSLVLELREMAGQFLRKRWGQMALAVMAGGSVLTAMTLGPWVAVFMLLRRQRTIL